MSLQVSTNDCSGNSSFGAQQVKFIPSLEQITIKELATLFLASPQKHRVFPFIFPKCSSAVIISASI